MWCKRLRKEASQWKMASVNVKSRNDFVALVLKFYIGFLSTKKIEDYMLLSFSSVLSGTIHDSENRMARVVF